MIEINGSTFEDSSAEPRLFEAFDALAPGATIVLASDRDLRPLLRALQSKRTGRFDWSTLDAQPAHFRIELRRRPAHRENVATVSDQLGVDHDRLDQLLAQTLEAARKGDVSEARAHFSTFCAGLERHIRVEEELLFPTIEELLQMPQDAGPTAVMRREHREIEQEITRIAAALSRDEAPKTESLTAILGAHNMKEEHVLYPSIDERLAPEPRAELCARLEVF